MKTGCNKGLLQGGSNLNVEKKKSCAEQHWVVGISDIDPDFCPPIRSSSQEQHMLPASGEASGQATLQLAHVALEESAKTAQGKHERGKETLAWP